MSLVDLIEDLDRAIQAGKPVPALRSQLLAIRNQVQALEQSLIGLANEIAVLKQTHDQPLPKAIHLCDREISMLKLLLASREGRAFGKEMAERLGVDPVEARHIAGVLECHGFIDIQGHFEPGRGHLCILTNTGKVYASRNGLDKDLPPPPPPVGRSQNT